MKIKLTTLLIVFVLLVIGGFGAYFLLKDKDVGVMKTTKNDSAINVQENNEKVDKLQKEKADLENKVEELTKQVNDMKLETNNISSKITNEEALKIATEVYHRAYTLIEEGYGICDHNKAYEKYGEKYYLVKEDLLKNIFTQKNLQNFERSMGKNSIYDGKDWYLKNTDGYFLSTIFGITDQMERPLTIVYSDDNKIIATGQIIETDMPWGGPDEYPYYIIFSKESGKWLIDLYE